MTIRHDIQPLINDFKQANGRGNTAYATTALMKMIDLLVGRLDKMASPPTPPTPPTPTFMPFSAPPTFAIPTQLSSSSGQRVVLAGVFPGYEAAVRSVFEPTPITEPSSEATEPEVTESEPEPEATEPLSEDVATSPEDDESTSPEPPIKRKRGRPVKNRSITQ